MRIGYIASVFVLALGLAMAQPANAQDAAAPPLIGVGEMAPEFSLPGATRYGILQDPVRLSDLRGEVVVLAFFFRARTRG